MSDTPRTDAAIEVYCKFGVHELMSTCESMERELTSARKDQAILGFECQKLTAELNDARNAIRYHAKAKELLGLDCERLSSENAELKKRLASITDQ